MREIRVSIWLLKIINSGRFAPKHTRENFLVGFELLHYLKTKGGNIMTHDP
jgi:hypothetical protein